MFTLVSASGFARGEQEPEIEAEPMQALPGTGPVLLDSGPHEKIGLLALPPNALSYYQGDYIDGTVLLRVRYTDKTVAIPEDWITIRCAAEPLRLVADGDALVYAYQSNSEGWTVFFEIPADYERGCLFMEKFLQRFRFFRSAKGPDASGVPFPAVVELPPN